MVVTGTKYFFCSASKRLHHPSSSSTPTDPLFSSAIVVDANTESDPAHSSMVLGFHGNGPLEISPIGCIASEVQHPDRSEGASMSCEEGGLLKEMKEKEPDVGREVRLADKVPCLQKFLSTPRKDIPMQVSVYEVNYTYEAQNLCAFA